MSTEISRGAVVPIRAVDYKGERFRLRQKWCEGLYARPGSYWMIGWYMARRENGKVQEYGVSTELWEPCTDEEIAAAIARMEQDAKDLIDRRPWASSPNE